MKNYLIRTWYYILNHHWTKDILRANLLYLILVILFEVIHFHLHPISGGLFFRMLIVLNICQFFKAGLDYIGKWHWIH